MLTLRRTKGTQWGSKRVSFLGEAVKKSVEMLLGGEANSLWPPAFLHPSLQSRFIVGMTDAAGGHSALS